jgi:hypothetical protein
MRNLLTGLLVGVVLGGGAVFLLGPGRTARTESSADSVASEHTDGVVTLGVDARTLVGLEVGEVASLDMPAVYEAYGRILDPTPLAGLVFDLDAARAAYTAAERESRRVERLYRADRNASARDRELAAAELGRTDAAVEGARVRLDTAFGQSLAGRDDLPALLRALVSGERALARVDLPPGHPLPSDPETTRLFAFGNEAPLTASFVGVAPQTDPLLQGRGLFFVIEREAPAPGTALTAWVRAPGDPLRGVEVPRDALVRHDGAVYVYVEAAPDRFERRALELIQPSEEGWLATGPLAPGDRIVVAGAPILLSSELQPQSSDD